MRNAVDITEYDGELRNWHISNICHVTVKVHFICDMTLGCKYKLNDNLIVLKYLTLLFCHSKRSILGQQKLVFMFSIYTILK